MLNNIIVRKYEECDIPAMAKIWNSVVEDGMAFPQEKTLSDGEAAEFFASQTHCGVAADETTGEIYGMYILHPNNVGRCSHISNASYAVEKNSRRLHIGEKLVRDCLDEAKKHGFKIRLLHRTFTHSICTNISDLKNSALFREDLKTMTASTRIFSRMSRCCNKPT